jgi:hypothetical protein
MNRTTLPIVIGVLGISSQLVYGEDNRAADQLPTSPADTTWKLVWNDEFEGTKLDETKWEVPPDAPRKGGWWMRTGWHALKLLGRAWDGADATETTPIEDSGRATRPNETLTSW